jgi:hypothetical protein
MKTPGHATNFRTWLFPQNEQYKAFLLTLYPLALADGHDQIAIDVPGCQQVCVRHLLRRIDDLNNGAPHKFPS